MNKKSWQALWSGLFVAAILFPAVAPGVSAWAVQGSWTNRSKVEITKVEFDDGQDQQDFGYHLSTEAAKITESAQAAGKDGNTELRRLINDKARGTYTDSDIADGEFFYNMSNCRGNNVFDIKDKKGGIAKNEAQYKPASLTITSDEVGTPLFGKCSLFIQQKDVSVEFKLDNPNNAHDIWFDAKDGATLIRVDGKDGEFKLIQGKDPHTYYANTGGVCSDGLYERVIVDTTKRNGGLNGADYETCQTGGEYNGRFGILVGTADKLDTAGTPTSTTNPPGTPGSGGTADNTPRCESGGLSWVICPIINMLAGASDKIYENLIKPALQTDSISLNSSDPQNYLFKAWSNVRLYGNIILVIGMLVVVFGQSIGGGLIDAYTAKKVLPRILAAAIMINLSIYIVAALVDITNVLGNGINGLFTAIISGSGGQPAGHIPLALNGGASAGLGIGAIIGGVAIWGLWGSLMQPILLFILVPLFFALLAVIITIIVRRGLILLLIITSPIAFALYCLPNTEQYFKKWWELLFKALLVYPIVGAVFGIANLMAVTINAANTTSTTGGTTSAIAQIVSMVVLVIPLFLIPYSFKLAGGILGNLHSQFTNYKNKAHQGILGNVNDQNSLRNRAKRGMTEQATRRQGRLVYSGRTTTPGTSDFKSRGRRALGRTAGLFGNVDSRMSDLTAQAAKRREQLSGTGDDFLIYAGSGYEESGKYYNGKGEEINVGDYKKGKSLYGNSPYAVGQALSYQASKIQTDSDVANFRKAFTQNAVANNWDNSEANGVWAAATYPHKGVLGSEWYSAPTTTTGANGKTNGVGFADVASNTKNYGKFIGDLHKTRQSFQLGSVRDQDWRAMAEVHEATQSKIAAGTATQDEINNLAMTDEVMGSMANQGLVTFNPDGEATVNGATAASKGVIEAMFSNRKYATTQAIGPTGDESIDIRSVYNRGAVESARTAHKAAVAGAAPGVVIAPFDEAHHIALNSVGQAKVTGDINRTGVPR